MLSMSKLMLPLWIFLGACYPWPTSASQWQEKIHRDGILIEQQQRHKKFRQMHTRGQMKVQAKPTAVLALLQDLPACQQWLYGCRSAKRLPNGLVHMVFDGPLWFKDRDVVFVTESQHDSSTGAWKIAITSQAHSALESKAIRIKQASASWVLQPMASGQLQITYELYMDPQIRLRSGVNKYNRDAMFRSLKALREWVQLPPYSTAPEPKPSD